MSTTYDNIVVKFQEDAAQAESSENYHEALVICVAALKELEAVNISNLTAIQRLELQYNHDMAMARSKFLLNLLSLRSASFFSPIDIINHHNSADMVGFNKSFSVSSTIRGGKHDDTPSEITICSTSVSRTTSLVSLPALDRLEIEPPTRATSTGTIGNKIYDAPALDRFAASNAVSAIQSTRHFSEKKSNELDQEVCREMMQIRANVLKCVIVEVPNITFKDVIGLPDAKLAMQEAVGVPLQFPDTAQAKNAWSGVLLFGPSGVGKTLLLKAVASECKMTFINVKVDAIMSKWQGESEKNIEALFEIARERSPSILFLDECDSLCRSRTSEESDASSRIKNKLLDSIDGFSTGASRVVIMANTNLPGSLDTAFLRRFPKRVYAGLPNASERLDMIRYYLREYTYSITKSDLKSIARRTDRFSGADLRTLVIEAGLVPCKSEIRKHAGISELRNQEKPVLRGLTTEDFNEALRRVAPTNDDKLLTSLMTWNEKFGGVNTRYEDLHEAVRLAKKQPFHVKIFSLLFNLFD